jgi:pyruvate formate lyase activating enzyme
MEYSVNICRKRFLEKSAQSLCILALGGTGFLSSACAGTKNEYYLRPAEMWKKAGRGAVDCLLCPNGCRISEGERGICRVRKNIDGSLYTLVYSRIAAAHVDPVEKKPMYHFLPGSKAFSIATGGCNLSCKFCQNWQLSQSYPEDLNAYEITPERLSVRAKSSGSKVIAYTYNEPTVQFEYIIDSSAIAKKNGLRPVIISNGYIMPEAGRKLAKNLDGIKIDLKAFTEKFYRSICGGSLKAVQDNLVSLHGLGKWLELVVLIIPTLNDSPDEIREMCKWVRKNLSSDVPMHFTRFHAMYKIQNLPPTPVSTLERCRNIAKDNGIRYPYIGNVPGHKWENTYCHNCNRMIIKRSGYFHIENSIRKGACPFCGTKIPGVWV